MATAIYMRAYREKNKEQLKVWQKQYRAKNKERINAYKREWYACNETSRDKHNARQRARAAQLKLEVLTHYSQGQIKCNCCGEQCFEFLTIDHMHGREIKTDTGNRVYLRLKKEGFPKGYQILCFNCNIAKGIYGFCPHTDADSKPTTQLPE